MTAPKRVLIIYTGGTIGMERSPRGYVPAPGRLQQQLERMPQFHDPAFPRFTTPETEFGRRIQYHIKEFAPLLDSSNMDMSDWVRLAVDIHAHYAEYDAFVVLHGTDTMAYTASALSFMLGNLGKTVVVMAHRPSAIAAVDKLIMLRDGQIEIFGDKDEVLQKVVERRGGGGGGGAPQARIEAGQ